MPKEEQIQLEKLEVNEIFYSLQGEGSRSGTANIFIRLSGCSAKHACFQSGVVCDTLFEGRTTLRLEDIYQDIKKSFPHAKSIIWTGGEPLDQLNEECISYFNSLGYFQALETSGIKTIPVGLDYVSISPKIAEHAMEKIHGKDFWVNELRYVIHSGQAPPEPKLKSEFIYISPHCDGNAINRNNLEYCMEMCKKDPRFRLSLQQHKIWQIL